MIFISVFILIFCYKLYRRFRFKIPPGPRPWPVVGNLYQMNPVGFRCFADWAQSYGPILSVWFGSRLNVVVSSSELAREVLKDNDLQLADRHRNRIATELSRNGKDLIWADYGPHYVKVRKVCSLELFSAKRLDALCPIREDEVRTMIGSIFKDCTNTPGKKLLLRKYLGAVALNHITRVVFGKSFVDSEGQPDEQGLELRTILNNGAKLGQTLTMAEHIPWLRWMFLLYKEAYAKQEASRSRFTMGIIDEHTKAREESAGGSKQNFVDALLSLKDQYHLSEDTIVGLLWDMIVAGMDTVAISVEWAMAELVKNPRVQKKAQEELDGVIGFERVMIESDFSSLSYLHCVVKEALRLHPPTPLMLPHRASANVKIGGYDIPKESVVHVNVWAIARDPNVWKDPFEFRPERFLEEDVDVKGHDFRLLPFGSGRRVCPGAQLGINLVTSMLGHLLHQFCWASPDGVEAAAIDMSHTPGLVTYMRTPLQAVATPRLSSHLYKPVASTELN